MRTGHQNIHQEYMSESIRYIAASFKISKPFKEADVIEYVHRRTLDLTNFNTARKEKKRSKLCNIVEDDFDTTVTTIRKPGFRMTSVSSAFFRSLSLKPQIHY